MGALDRIRRDPRVRDVSDERADDDGIFVRLKAGYADLKFDPLNPSHTIHEWSVRAIQGRMKGVTKCDCRECKEARDV